MSALVLRVSSTAFPCALDPISFTFDTRISVRRSSRTAVLGRLPQIPENTKATKNAVSREAITRSRCVRAGSEGKGIEKLSFAHHGLLKKMSHNILRSALDAVLFFCP